jgi:hypothetical protein
VISAATSAYVRAPSLDDGQSVKVEFVTGYGATNLTTIAGLGCTTVAKACHGSLASSPQTTSDRLFALKVSTTSPTPLHGTLYVTFEIQDA